MSKEWTSSEGFERLVREHQGMVFRTLTRLTGPGAQVEDLAQEVFLRLYRALPEFRGTAMLSTYLYRIVYNVAQDEWKRRRRERERFGPEPSGFEDDEPGEWMENQPGDLRSGEHNRTPEEVVSDTETQAAVEAALLDLPEAERAVLVLFHSEDLSYEGIAAALGLPLNTVRTHLHRGRKRLAELVTKRLARQTRPTEASTQAGNQ
ncbi:MAG: RNA polymerase sigma factor [Janthinobacterium lividum]